MIIGIVPRRSALQSLEIAADLVQKIVVPLDRFVVRSRCAAKNGRLVSVDKENLAPQKFGVIVIGLCINVKADQRRVGDGNHVIKPEQAERAAVQTHNMLPGLNLSVRGLGRLHGNKIPVFADVEDDADIRAALILVVLHPGINLGKEIDVFVRDTINAKLFQNDPPL